MFYQRVHLIVYHVDTTVDSRSDIPTEDGTLL